MKIFGQISELVKVLFRQNGQEVSLDSNSATTYTADRDVELPPGDQDSILVGESNTQVLTNKTIDGDNNTVQDLPVTALKTVLADANKVFSRDASGVPKTDLLVNANVDPTAAIDASKIADGSVSNAEFQALNGLTGSITTNSNSQTLTNKTIDGDDNTITDVGIASLKTVLADANKVIRRDNSGAVVSDNAIPNSSALVTTDSTQTLSNKSYSDNITLLDEAGIAFREDTGSGTNQVIIKAPATLAADYTLTLPPDDGASGQVLQTDGSGITSWTTPAAATPANVRAPEGAGTTTLTSADNKYQVFTLTAGRNVNLPTTGILAGDIWTMQEVGGFVLQVRASDSSNIAKVRAGTVKLMALINTPVSSGDWLVILNEQPMSLDSGITLSAGFGTVTELVVAREISNNMMTIQISGLTGTVTAATAYVELAPGYTLSSGIYPNNGYTVVQSFWKRLNPTGGGSPIFDTSAGVLTAYSTDLNRLFLVGTSASNVFPTVAVNAILGSSERFVIQATFAFSGT